MIYNIITHFYSLYLISYSPHADRILPNLPIPHKRLLGSVLEVKNAPEQI